MKGNVDGFTKQTIIASKRLNSFREDLRNFGLPIKTVGYKHS